MRQIYFSFFLLLFATPFVFGSKGKQNNWYPMHRGNQWEYNKIGDSKNKLVAKVVDAYEKPEGLYSKIESRFGDKIGTIEHLVTSAGVFVERSNGEKVGQSLILKYPLKSGEKWKTKMTASNQEWAAEFKVGEPETLPLPIGKVRAVGVFGKIYNSSGKEVSDEKIWYAKGIGPVKYVLSYSGYVPFTLELQKFSRGK